MKKGFTLIELMIVVIIIGIIAAIAIPNLLKAQAKAKIGACKGNEKIIYDAVAQCYTEQQSITNYAEFIAGGVAPTCPQGSNAYAITAPTGANLNIVVDCPNDTPIQHGNYNGQEYADYGSP